VYIESQLQRILNLNLYGEHMPEERITGSKIYLYASIFGTKYLFHL